MVAVVVLLGPGRDLEVGAPEAQRRVDGGQHARQQRVAGRAAERLVELGGQLDVGRQVVDVLPELQHQALQPGPFAGRGALGGEADGQRLELPAHVEDVLGYARHGVAHPLAQHQRVEQVPLRLGGDDRALALTHDQQPPVDEQADALAQGGA